MVYDYPKPSSYHPILGARQEIPTTASLSPFQLGFQQAYETICIVGLVFTTTLLISLSFGGRRRHPVVIAFISTAMLNYWNGLLPWFFNFWGKQISLAVGGHDIPTHIACQVNSVFGSYLQTVIPSFAAAFIGEALRIT